MKTITFRMLTILTIVSTPPLSACVAQVSIGGYEPGGGGGGGGGQSGVGGSVDMGGSGDWQSGVGGSAGVGGSGGGASGICGPVMPCSGDACGLAAMPTDYDAVHGPEGLALGDMDGDGILDVVVANDEGANPGSVSVYLGSCGVLSSETRYGYGGINSRAAATGDVNGDGKLDVVTADGTGSPDIPCSVSVYLGNGDGSLQSPLVFENGGLQTGSLVLADINGDGKLDVATANEVSGDVSILLGAGDGTFSPYQLVSSGAPDDFGNGIVARDIDADGHIDLALGNRSEYSISLLFGHGDGTFAPFKKVHVGTYESGPIGVAIADINGDGHLDLVASDSWNGAVRFFAGLGNRAFAPAVTSSAGADLYLKGIVLADFTLDGQLDAAVLNDLNGHDVRILAGHGDGTFELVSTLSIGDYPQENAIVTGDLNADGRPDLVVSARNSFLTQVFLSGN